MFQVIVYPTKESLQLVGATLILGLIWLISFTLAAPLFIFKDLRTHELNLTGNGISSVSFCIEDWPIEHGRAYYSIFSLIMQYTVPIIILSVRLYLPFHHEYVLVPKEMRL